MISLNKVRLHGYKIPNSGMIWLSRRNHIQVQNGSIVKSLSTGKIIDRHWYCEDKLQKV